MFRGHRISRADGSHDGIFAEWRWDGRRLTVRNDRYGFQPLFYFCAASEIAVSTSILALLAAGAPADLDEDALAVFLRLGFFVGNDTPFRSIRVVPPDAQFVWEDGQLKVDGRYWHGRPQRLTRDAALDAYIALFRQAIARRPPNDDNFVVPLSGGRDSRHILLELCDRGWRPRYAVTIPRYPPRAGEDERVAALLARATGVPHLLLDQRADRLESEWRKNWQTHLCADEHAWYLPMIDHLESDVTTVYDGMGGALSVAGRFLSADNIRRFDAGHFDQLADVLLDGFGRMTERFLARMLSPRYRITMGRDRARQRLAADLVRHADAPDPTKSFNFWNRTRREIALVTGALMNRIPTVYSPYLDHDLYELLSSLPPSLVSPDLSSPDKSFHSDAITRAYPRYAHIPFEDSHAPPIDARSHDGRFGSAVARHLLERRRRFTLLNNGYVWPRVGLSAIKPQYAGRRPWLAGILLYLSQLEDAPSVARGTLRRCAPRAPRRDSTT
jgi:hypothetical protein